MAVRLEEQASGPPRRPDASPFGGADEGAAAGGPGGEPLAAGHLGGAPTQGRAPQRAGGGGVFPRAGDGAHAPAHRHRGEGAARGGARAAPHAAEARGEGAA
eukprot:9490652-Pyramimonas_sp.AAC.1